ncbi:hypothetical protein GQ42DRAFT_160013 [Ramicandelaber brevisporus]|nr:hypothetical protein GQ42DRAFT_160013 [Ramicandelaber brevisporus]
MGSGNIGQSTTSESANKASNTKTASYAGTNNFIVMFKPDTEDKVIDDAVKQIESQNGKIKARYSIIKGFAAALPSDSFNTLSVNEHVSTIEPDGIVSINN